MSLKVSQRLDGQLSGEETQSVLAELAVDPQQRDRFTVYALIGDVLRGNPTPDDAYTHRILERLRREGSRMDPDFDPLRDDEG
ncbi:MAG TPA: RseA family anti-sigma factor [Steroidobacteraceae bacterium]|nr:RseA family anti-sigma factor [Steroidobacteraceae bacterium]